MACQSWGKGKATPGRGACLPGAFNSPGISTALFPLKVSYPRLYIRKPTELQSNYHALWGVFPCSLQRELSLGAAAMGTPGSLPLSLAELSSHN